MYKTLLRRKKDTEFHAVLMRFEYTADTLRSAELGVEDE